jgi:hypothetical protein
VADSFDEWMSVIEPPDELDPTGVPPRGKREFLRAIFDEHGALGADQVRARWIERQLELARDAAELFAADVRATTDIEPPSFEFRTESDGVRVAYRGSYATTAVMAITAPEVICEVSDFMQDEVVEDLHSGWPMCPEHAVGAYPGVVEDGAVWYCRKFQHIVAPIGRLAR